MIDEAALVRDGPEPGDAAVCQVRPERASVVWKARVSTSFAPLDGAENFPVSIWGKRPGCETNAIPTAAPDNPHVRFSAEEGWFRVETGRTCGFFASAGCHCAFEIPASFDNISGRLSFDVSVRGADGNAVLEYEIALL